MIKLEDFNYIVLILQETTLLGKLILQVETQLMPSAH